MTSWPATYADRAAIYDVRVALNPTVRDAVTAIPGVYAREYGLVAPWSAVHAVHAALGPYGADAQYYPRVVLPPTRPSLAPTVPLDEQLSDLLSGSFLRSWVWMRGTDDKRFMLDYQARCVAFGASQGSANVWAAPGAGKTLIALGWAANVWRDRPNGTTGPIVVITRRTAAIQWVRQVRRFCDGADALELRPASLMRKSDPEPAAWIRETQRQGKAPIVIASWGELVDRRAEILAWHPTAVVFDEAHYAKDARRKRWILDENDKRVGRTLETRSSAAEEIAKAVPRRLGTTASPIANELDDLWGQLTLIEPYAWGGTATKFRLRYCGARPGEYGGLVMGEPTNIVELRQRIAWSTIQISYATSHAELPPKRREVRRIPVDEQDAQIDGDAKELKAAIRGDDRNRVTEIRLARNASRKRSAVVSLVQETRDARAEGGGKGKILVFDGRKKNVDALAKAIAHGAKIDVITVTGDDDAVTVAQRVAAYMDHPGPVALVATWQRLGSSIDLHDTDCLCWAMLPWTPEAVEQGEGRVDRLGMTRPVLYAYLVAQETTDEHVAGILLDKLPAVESVTPGRRLESHGSLRAQLAREDETDAILDALAAKIANEEVWD